MQPNTTLLYKASIGRHVETTKQTTRSFSNSQEGSFQMRRLFGNEKLHAKDSFKAISVLTFYHHLEDIALSLKSWLDFLKRLQLSSKRVTKAKNQPKNQLFPSDTECFTWFVRVAIDIRPSFPIPSKLMIFMILLGTVILTTRLNLVAAFALSLTRAVSRT